MISKFGPFEVKFGGTGSKFGPFLLNSVVFGPVTERFCAGILALFAKRKQIGSKFGVRAAAHTALFSFSAAGGLP